MKKKSIKLSKLELQVMRPFWSNPSMTIREAADTLAQLQDDPGYSTVQTIAGRLEKKGALVRISKVGNAWLFKAAVEKECVVNRMLDEIITLLDGAPSPILSHLVESEKIGESELEEIRRMITEKETKEGESRDE